MRTTLNFIFLSFLMLTIGSFEGKASASKLAIIEEKDPEGFFRLFREKPAAFTANDLKVFLKRTGDLYPVDVTYEKNGQTYKSKIYKRFFNSDGYYFTFLTRHNLISEEFFNLENVKVKFDSTSRSGLQTKLHYSIYLGNNETPFSFRILYASELKKIMASIPLVHAYQKTRTEELTKKVASHISGDWREAVKKQAQLEQKCTEKAKEKNEPTREFIEKHYRQIAQATTSPDILTPNEGSLSATLNEGQPSATRKFSIHRLQLPIPAAKSPPKNVGFNISENAKKEIEQQYEQLKIPSERGKSLKKKSSRALLAKQREFETKRDEEKLVNTIGRRASISSSSVPPIATSPRESPERVESGPRSAPSISSPRLKKKEKLTSLVEKDHESSLDTSHSEEFSEVSQADIQELFEDMSGSE